MGYQLNGQNVSIGEEPFERDGKNFIPVKAVTQGLGGHAEWDNNQKVATTKIGQWTAQIQMQNPVVQVSSDDGRSQQVTLSAAPFVENDTMYVPWDFYRDVYGYKTDMSGGQFSAGL